MIFGIMMNGLISHLHRTATKHSVVGNWALGVQYLSEAKELLKIETKTHYPFQTWLRLPVFLQHAGEFNAAILECEALLNLAIVIRKMLVPNEAELPRSRYLHLCRRDVYDKMRMICKREKNKELEKQYINLRNQEMKFFDGKEKLIALYLKKAKKGDQNACAAIGHDWKCVGVTSISIKRVCKVCKLEKSEPFI